MRVLPVSAARLGENGTLAAERQGRGAVSFSHAAA
jgi:hypothetical protein